MPRRGTSRVGTRQAFPDHLKIKGIMSPCAKRCASALFLIITRCQGIVHPSLDERFLILCMHGLAQDEHP